MFYQDGDSPVSLALKRTLEEARFAWVLDFLNLLTVCYNKFVPVVSTSSVSLCVVALIFFILKFQLLFPVNFLYWNKNFGSLRVNLSRVNFQYLY